jgi:uncharacterized membrane protein
MQEHIVKINLADKLKEIIICNKNKIWIAQQVLGDIFLLASNNLYILRLTVQKNQTSCLRLT